jgi:hypothetical protein
MTPKANQYALAALKDRRASAGRVRGNLAYLQRQGKVRKDASGDVVRWSLL